MTKVDEKLFVFKYCFIFIVLVLDTSMHVSRGGYTDGIQVLIEAGASMSAVDKYVIKPSVKLMQSNIKLFK